MRVSCFSCNAFMSSTILPLSIQSGIKEFYDSSLCHRMLCSPLQLFDPNRPPLSTNATDADYMTELSKLAQEDLSLHLNALIEQDKRKKAGQKHVQEKLQLQIQELQARFAKKSENFNPPTQWFMLASGSASVTSVSAPTASATVNSTTTYMNDWVVRVLALDGQYRLAVTERSIEIWRCAGGTFGNALDDGQESFKLVGIVKPGHLTNITAVLDVPTPSSDAFAAEVSALHKDGTQQPRASNVRRPGSSTNIKEVKKTMLLGCADGQGVLVDISVCTESSSSEASHPGTTKINTPQPHHQQNQITSKCTIHKQRKLSSSAVRQGTAAAGLIAVAAATGLYLFTPELETRFSWPADALLSLCRQKASRVPQPEMQARGVTTSDVTIVFVTTDASRRCSRVFALLSTGALAVIEWCILT